MAGYALIRGNIVENIIRLDSGANWSPPSGTIIVQSDEARVGGTYDGVTFTPPVPPEVPMTAFTHWARVDSFQPANEKPLRVKREWLGVDRLVDCYVTQAVRDLWPGGIAVNDFVIIEFVDGDLNKPLAISKVFKSW